MFDLIAREYRLGNLTKRQLAQYVQIGWITLDEAKLIITTGGNVGAFADPAPTGTPSSAASSSTDAAA